MIILKNSVNWLENKWFLLVFSLVYIDIVVTNSIFWISIPLFLMIPVTYVMKAKGYGYKLYYTLIFSLVALEALLLICLYLIYPAFIRSPMNFGWFLFFSFLTLFTIFLYARLLINGQIKLSEE